MPKKPSTPQQRLRKPQNSRIKAAEWKRLQVLTRFEREARQNGCKLIAGVDEAGRGPLAGPVVAAACIIPEDRYIVGVDDSKKLTPEQRRAIFNELHSDVNIRYGVGIVHSEEIDRINIYQATISAMIIAIERLLCLPDLLLVDGMHLKHQSIPCQKIIKGDQLSQSIAAASIIAKETRDRIMREYHLIWPHYGFDRHKGYGTQMHVDALEEHGPCPIHRTSFKVKSMQIELIDEF